MSKLTVQNIRTFYERFKRDTLPDVSEALFVDFVNDVQIDVFVYLKDVNSNDYIENHDFSYSSDTESLPVDFGSAVGMDVGLYRLINGKESGASLPVSHPGSDLKGYYIDGTDIKLVGSFSDGESLRFRYLTKTTDLTEYASETIFDDDRRLYSSIRNMLNMLYEGWNNNEYEEIRSGNKYTQDAANLSLYLRKQINTLNQSYDV